MAALSRPLALAERPSHHHRLPREKAFTTLLTTRARDGHRHCGVFVGDTGLGVTDPGPDGHTHRIYMLAVLPAAGHAHELSTERCPRVHNFDPTHGNLHR